MLLKQSVFTITCAFILHVTLCIHTPAARINPAECRSLIDLYVVIDGSDSISYHDFGLLKTAVENLIPEIDLGHNKARIGMLVYSSHVPVMSEHDFSYNQHYLINAAKTLQHPRDGTDTALGIKHMKKFFKKNGRKNVPWVCVVITDGISKNATETIKQAKQADKMGISMFAVGIGHRIALRELENIASTPNQVMAIDDFSQLQNMLKQMMFTICPCPVPPTVPHAKCNDGARAIGTVRTYTCESGYLQRGKSTIQCQRDFTWTPLSLDFECVSCRKETPVVKNGICSGGEFTIGTTRTYTCKKGYRPVGDQSIKCLNDATWSKPNFECVPCGPTPVIENGLCGEGKFTIGTHRKLSCLPGYRAIGTADIECLDNMSWASPQWSQPDFQCVPCGPTPVIENGLCGDGKFTIGTHRKLSCLPGYRAIGTADIECLDNMAWASPQWSQPDFQCVPCGQTPVIENGLCGDGKFTIGTHRKLSCLPGYRAIGTADIECLDNVSWASPQWSQPDFQCVPCGPTPVIENGLCGDGKFTIGTHRKLSCLSGYRAIGTADIECLDNVSWASPQWSQPDFQCVPCGPTPVIENGICGDGKFTIGTNRKLSCLPGYRAIGTADIECIDNVSWASPQWSQPDFQCVPCGPTPVIENGLCGDGKFTIGTHRKLSCLPGYRAIGTADIECLDNVSWASPQWSQPDFQCVPCGQTPVIENGLCGKGKFTIGTHRKLSCLPGYRAIGTADIECLDNVSWASPQWSQPDFQCVPCGPTPVIENGLCGDGKFTIGTHRKLSCLPGYRAIGTADIECLDNMAWTSPQWSKSDFQCVPCGQTPVIENGLCGDGKYTIGTHRKLSCLPGYRAIGTADIECLDNMSWASPQWSQPDFQCVPCGSTPVIENGLCGDGKFTIGTHRKLSCLPGYRAIGTADIECIDNVSWASPQWSQPDFQCVPCGPTPVIENGLCGDGKFTIGTHRKLSCLPGYRAIGTADIECLDNMSWASPQWSQPDFQCVPCGPTPVIENGLCGDGKFTIGTHRKLSCLPGYRAIGTADIECLDNMSWASPQWSQPDFQCVSCGPTPVIENGLCGDGKFTIGTHRKLSCLPGYRAIGTADIECLDNMSWASPQWSQPDFQCVPCGPTPVIENAICKDGVSILGTQRTYTCMIGYVLKGNPTTTCQDDATWSNPSFTCHDCGDPPMVANAYTGTGPSTVGAKRVYFCEDGFKMVGKGVVKCKGSGKWEKPKFSCEGITTNMTTGEPSVCDSCRFINGVGYNNHPYDCNQFVQCFKGNRGLEPAYRKCPFGLFWDQNALTCKPSHEVDCPNDQCKNPLVQSYQHKDPNKCCAYWKCKNGRAYGECCGEGSSFSRLQNQCVPDAECLDTCPFHDEIPVCDKRPTGKDTMFEQHIGNNHWVTMHCAPGTAFNPVDCKCSLFIMNVPGRNRQQLCKPEIFLPFTNSFQDRSGKNVFVKPENVTIHRGAALFNGNSRIIINRFANTEFYGDLVIKFRYNEFKRGSYFNKLQALVTNGDCGSDPSILYKDFCKDKDWKEVIYIHNMKKLEGRVCGASKARWSYGHIQANHCALQVGYGSGLQSYVGLIDDLYVYQCRPRNGELNIGY
ncbi:sushi, von Willebrand factor type A, EGF and pentraxin domain-containing protein 1-like [Ruditapes philippinarum]|uniref:sushi, von Willebrand factor type A, EGF and pentraxin domain-containing protein 1-like n=1 Tax=Ruditapes philippinarum TaxID=129788 RepID=UPI00295B2C46|nr:sushi, von Willebrand factor type A, EGF and pentraxin domain-containing protein 1-like [Ruditapes philippinarum]